MKYPWHFAPLPLWLLESKLSFAAKVIYGRLAFAMQADATCTVKVEMIGRWVGLKRRRIHQALAELRKASLLAIKNHDRYWVTYQLSLNPPAAFRCPEKLLRYAG